MFCVQRPSFKFGLTLLFLLSALAWKTKAEAASLRLNWGDNSTNESGFKIERKTGTAGTYAQIGTVGVGITSYTDSSLTDGTTYCYRVRAYNSSSDSPYSNEACVATPSSPPPPDTTAPALVVVSHTNNQIVTT